MVCSSDDVDEDTNITLEGVQVAVEAFARCGGAPEFQVSIAN